LAFLFFFVNAFLFYHEKEETENESFFLFFGNEMTLLELSLVTSALQEKIEVELK
jgi:hypothetical protein